MQGSPSSRCNAGLGSRPPEALRAADTHVSKHFPAGGMSNSLASYARSYRGYLNKIDEGVRDCLQQEKRAPDKLRWAAFLHISNPGL